MGGGVDDNTHRPGSCLMNHLYDFTFMITLAKQNGQVILGGNASAERFDIVQSISPINLGLSGAQQVQVRAVEYMDRLGTHLMSLEPTWEIAWQISVDAAKLRAVA